MRSKPDCPYCGGLVVLVDVDTAQSTAIWECKDCHSEFGEEASGGLVYVLDFDEPIRPPTQLF